MQLQKQECNINFMNTDNIHKHIFPYYYLYDDVSDSSEELIDWGIPESINKNLFCSQIETDLKPKKKMNEYERVL